MRRALLDDAKTNYPSFSHPDVLRNANTWRMIRDCVEGDEAIKARTEVYLPRLEAHALERWAREGRYRNDGINVEAGLEMELAYIKHRKRAAFQLDNGEKPESFSLLEHVIRDLKGSAIAAVKWVHDGKNYKVDGIECGQHGFRGKNGTHATASGLAELGLRITIGDKHSPEICDGVFVAGVMELQHGYNKGPSGWSVTHVIQYPNGKRSMITLQGGKWRAPRRIITTPRSTDNAAPALAA